MANPFEKLAFYGEYRDSTNRVSTLSEPNYPELCGLRIGLENLTPEDFKSLLTSPKRKNDLLDNTSIRLIRDFADKKKLRGKEKILLMTICDAGGEKPISDLSTVEGLDWLIPEKGFEDTSGRLNRKLRKIGWRLHRKDNKARLIQISKPNSAKPAKDTLKK